MKRQFPRIIGLCIFVLGFSSIFTQIYFLREFLTVFHGNELVIGIVLASWMLLTGFGAWLGKYFHKIRGRLGFILFLQILLTVLPVLTVVKIDLWKSVVFPTGMETGLTQIIYTSFLLQMPFCLVNGFLFTAYTSVLSSYSGENRTGRSYVLESLGSVFGGMIVNFILLWYLGIFQSLLILVTINLMAISIFVSLFKKTALRILLVFLMLLISAVFYLVDLQGITRRWMFPGQHIVYDQANPYGSVVVTENAGQLNFYENGLLHFSSGNEIFNEEAVHYAMVQHPDPKRIFLVAGGISGIMDEIMKYHPLQIDYFELNPAITQLGKQVLRTLRAPVIRIHNEDARNYIKKRNDKFDVALINLPGPSTIQINRYYTGEFFNELKKHLNAAGILSLSLPSTSDYVSETAGDLNAVILNSLQQVFKNVLIVPGFKNYFLASDSTLSLDISTLISSKSIETVYVNSYYLDDKLLKDRSAFIMKHLKKTAEINNDFKPLGYYYQVQYWTTFFKTNYFILALVILLIVLFIIFNLTKVSIALFTGGFTASSIEIFLILSFQIMNGYVFSMVGMIIMIFMAGLAIGAVTTHRIFPAGTVKNYVHIQLAIALYAMVFPFIILKMNDLGSPSWLNIPIIGFLTLLISWLTGIEFALAAKIRDYQVNLLVARNYSADLFGSAFGALITSILLLPLLGMVNSCMVLASLNVISALVMIIYRKKFVSL